MPLGSSSDAPVIRPGPSTANSRGLLGPTVALGARPAACATLRDRFFLDVATSNPPGGISCPATRQGDEMFCALRDYLEQRPAGAPSVAPERRYLTATI